MKVDEACITSKQARIDRLVALRQKMQLENSECIRKAFLELEAERLPITVAGVAKHAGVARQTVYSSPYIKEIQDATNRTSGMKSRASMPAQMTNESKDRRLQQEMEVNRKLRIRIKELETTIATLLSTRREPKVR